jgi:hypothetical protein
MAKEKIQHRLGPKNKHVKIRKYIRDRFEIFSSSLYSYRPSTPSPEHSSNTLPWTISPWSTCPGTFPWIMRSCMISPLDDTFLGRIIPWMKRPLNDWSHGRMITNLCVPSPLSGTNFHNTRAFNERWKVPEQDPCTSPPVHRSPPLGQPNLPKIMAKPPFKSPPKQGSPLMANPTYPKKMAKSPFKSPPTQGSPPLGQPNLPKKMAKPPFKSPPKQGSPLLGQPNYPK